MRLRKNILLLPFILSALSAAARQTRDTLTADFVRQYAYTFHIENGQLSGAGADTIRKNISDVEFVTLGELHQSARLAEFTTVLLRELSARGFHHFAVETGPETARELMDLSNPPGATAASLRIMNRQYGSRLYGLYPFIFFQGVEDAKFLQCASEHRYDLWGLDQEFEDSYLFWIDKLKDLIQVENRSAMQLFHEARNYIEIVYGKSKLDKEYKVNYELLNNQDCENFFRTFSANNTAAQRIIKALEDSWHIYSLYETGKYAENNLERSDYMKNNFINYYHKALASGENSPKVFVKMGSIHTSKGKTLMNVDDIGKLVNDLAEQNKSQVTSFRHLRRYHYKNGEIVDYLTSGENWIKNYQPFLEQGDKIVWTIIDFRTLRTKLLEKSLLANKDAVYEIMNYDFMLISPADKTVELNF